MVLVVAVLLLLELVVIVVAAALVLSLICRAALQYLQVEPFCLHRRWRSSSGPDATTTKLQGSTGGLVSTISIVMVVYIATYISTHL